MANTKKVLEDEFKQAESFNDVNNQDTKTRLAQSLQTSYGQAIDESNKSYDLNYNAADRASVGRGMQRSSYNMQTLANINTQKAQAADKLRQNMIADYQNRLTDLEQQEYQRDFQERQLAENQRQYNENLAFQKEQWQATQDQWRQEFEYNKMSTDQQIAYNYIMNMLESGDNPSDDLLKRAGISRSDYNQMKATATAQKSGSSGSYAAWKAKQDALNGNQNGNGNGIDDSSVEQNAQGPDYWERGLGRVDNFANKVNTSQKTLANNAAKATAYKAAEEEDKKKKQTQASADFKKALKNATYNASGWISARG